MMKTSTNDALLPDVSPSDQGSPTPFGDIDITVAGSHTKLYFLADSAGGTLKCQERAISGPLSSLLCL